MLALSILLLNCSQARTNLFTPPTSRTRLPAIRHSDESCGCLEPLWRHVRPGDLLGVDQDACLHGLVFARASHALRL
jgi:hypothetical protein